MFTHVYPHNDRWGNIWLIHIGILHVNTHYITFILFYLNCLIIPCLCGISPYFGHPPHLIYVIPLGLRSLKGLLDE